VEVGFTVADCLGGYAAMAADTAVTWAATKFIGSVAGVAGAEGKDAVGIIASVLGKQALAIHATAAAKAGIAARPATAEGIRAVSNLAAGFIVGSPLGYSRKHAEGSVYGAAINDGLADLISPTPALSPSSSGLPPSSPSPPSAAPATDRRTPGR
jgi:hypothetical protein